MNDNWFVRHAPFVNTIRRHHTAHHNQGIMMTHNMNLTFPIANWVMGTSDLRRGLLGSLFNGYSGSARQAGVAAYDRALPPRGCGGDAGRAGEGAAGVTCS